MENDEYSIASDASSVRRRLMPLQTSISYLQPGYGLATVVPGAVNQGNNSSRQVATRAFLRPAGSSNAGPGAFGCFLKLPVEVQTQIWTEALRKPSIHFIDAKRRPFRRDGYAEEE